MVGLSGGDGKSDTGVRDRWQFDGGLEARHAEASACGFGTGGSNEKAERGDHSQASAIEPRPQRAVRGD